MKSCPQCKSSYTDETLTFCVIDGSVLTDLDDSTGNHNSGNRGVTEPAKTALFNPMPPADSKQPQLSTIVAAQPLPIYAPKQPAQSTESSRGKPKLLIGIAIATVLLVVVGVGLGFVWMSQDETPEQQSGTKKANVNLKPEGKTTATVAGWGARYDKASLEGERLTYYPVTTPDQCQIDCDKQEACRGFTFIRAGTYNPNDSAMCYLMTKVTGTSETACCISAIKE